MNKINWGIIGLGGIAHKFVLDLQLIEDANLYAVASRSLEKAEEFAIQYDADTFYGDYESLVNDEFVDIIYIATPHHLHYQWAICALQNGKSVLCEKPMGVNRHQVAEMIDMAVKNKVFLMEALWTRFNPAINEIEDRIKANEIGDLNYLNADFCFDMIDSTKDRVLNMDLAGGALLDIGIYPVFLAYLFFGKPLRVRAVGRKHESGADIQTAISMVFPNGMASLSCGFVSKSDMRAHLYGTKGKIEIFENWHESEGFSINDKEYHYPKQGRGYTYEIKECHWCLQSGKIQSELWSHENSLDLVDILDMIRAEIDLQYPFE